MAGRWQKTGLGGEWVELGGCFSCTLHPVASRKVREGQWQHGVVDMLQLQTEAHHFMRN